MRKTWDLVYITGGSSGIGYAIAQQVLSEGSAVVLFARDQQRLSQAAAQLCSAADEARVHTMTMDVASQDDVLRRTAEAIRLYGAPDLLINSAGWLILITSSSCPSKSSHRRSPSICLVLPQ